MKALEAYHSPLYFPASNPRGSLPYIVFVAFLVFGYTVNQHTVVVSSFPVVVCQLALFLCAPLLRLRLAVQFLSSGFIFSQCAMSEPLSSCTFSASGITAIPSRVKPCSLTSLPHAMVTLIDSVVKHFHQLVDRQVVGRSPTPVVLYFRTNGW